MYAFLKVLFFAMTMNKQAYHSSFGLVKTLSSRIAMMLLFVASGAMAQPLSEAEQIKSFYVQYMEAIDKGRRERVDLLVDSILTPEMRDKKGRLTAAMGADPLLRAQDVSAFGMQSLECRHLEGGWYEVSYRWNQSDTASIHIPLMVRVDKKGRVKIAYVTPEWAGRGYGDYLFNIPKVKVQDKKDATTFVESFFKAYTYRYVKMSPTLEEDLARLRTAYFTPAMQDKYSKVVHQYRDDYCYVDPAVGCEDFDAFWYESIRVISSDFYHFTVCYGMPDNGYGGKVEFTLTRQKGRWRVSDMKTQ